MKLTRLFTACAVAACAALLASSLQAADGPVKFADGRAIVRAMTGSAQFQLPNDPSWAPLKINAILKPGTTVKTADGAQVDLFLGENGPVVRVTPASTLTLAALGVAEVGGEKIIDTKLGLSNGSILGNVKKLAKASNYQVNIPNGVCAIRGTQFQVSANGNLTVLEGTVVITFTPPGQPSVTLSIPAGQSFTPPAGVGPVVVAVAVGPNANLPGEQLVTITKNQNDVVTVITKANADNVQINVDPKNGVVTVNSPDTGIKTEPTITHEGSGTGGTATGGTATGGTATGGTATGGTATGGTATGGTGTGTGTAGNAGNPVPPTLGEVVFKVDANGKLTVSQGTVRIGESTYTSANTTGDNNVHVSAGQTIYALKDNNGNVFAGSGQATVGVPIAVVTQTEGSYGIQLSSLPAGVTSSAGTDGTVTADTPVH